MAERTRRARVAMETEAYFPEIFSIHGDRLTSAIKRTVFYSSTQPLPKANALFETSYRVFNGDTLDVARKLIDEGKKPCVLNLASELNPGGGWKNGSLAQEEELFRRSTYALSLDDPGKIDRGRTWRYPIPLTGGIYSPDVFVFRDSNKEGYTVLKYKDCFFLDFVAVPALRHPRLVKGRLDERAREVTKEKMRTILRIAFVNGHISLLLGAMGCGAFGNSPDDISSLFAEVFGEPEFFGRFASIDFAILDDSRSDNLPAFRRKFGQKG